MTRYRMIVSILVLIPVLSAATRSSALANSLLGGYGGPGQGNQAILGSALLKGPRGGGGTGAGSPRASGSAASSSTGSTSIGAPGGGGRVTSHRSEAPVSLGDGKRVADTIGQASGKPSGPYSISERGEAASSAVADSGTLGLSGADLLYALLALCVLVFTAVLTRHLTRTRWREGTSS
jgi:hypothetical protein